MPANPKLFRMSTEQLRATRQAQREAYLRWVNSLTHGRIKIQRRGGGETLYARINQGFLTFDRMRNDGKMTCPEKVELTVALPNYNVIKFVLGPDQLRPCAFLPPASLPGPNNWSIIVPSFVEKKTM